MSSEQDICGNVLDGLKLHCLYFAIILFYHFRRETIFNGLSPRHYHISYVQLVNKTQCHVHKSRSWGIFTPSQPSIVCRGKTGWVPQPLYKQWPRELLVSTFAEPLVLAELSWHTNFTTATTKSCKLHEIWNSHSGEY